jgi:RNA polymerase sigma-70 factor (ECF subfamily)
VLAEQRNTNEKGDQTIAYPTTINMRNPSDVSALTEQYRSELLLHCYRLVGSLHDAEDMVQETMLRAWRHFETFKGQSTLRTWLYQIATNVCLDALKKRSRRTLPTAIYQEAEPLSPSGPRLAEALWLDPFPGSWLAEATENPEARYSRHESISLAFMTALQLLPPRQRAILILSDVLDWRANEVAHLLEISVSAVNSALHRARVTLEKHYHVEQRESPIDEATNSLLSRYVHAWETDDIAELINVLKEDAILSMPPFAVWFRGREQVSRFLATKFRPQHPWHLYPTSASGQPAFITYRATDNIYRSYGIQVVSIVDGQIATITAFLNPELVTSFGYPSQREP